ncbi:MAG: hypothetical protein VX049_03575 [Pseudomonadota bacterium]|nr:hypothetical protein [Pseudomonadota bacterium]
MVHFLNHKIKTELIVITKDTLKIIENPDAKLFLEKFYSRLKAVTSEEQWIELFMELSAIMYFDFPLSRSELRSIDKLLEACELISRSQEADMSLVH